MQGNSSHNSFPKHPITNYSQCLCHCYDCRKIGGSTYSLNLIVPNENFKLETAMTLKQYLKPTEPGRKVQMNFCGMLLCHYMRDVD